MEPDVLGVSYRVARDTHGRIGKIHKQNDLVSRAHNQRWRRISKKFPLIVAKAYDGDLYEALKHDEETVLRKVREFEVSKSIEPHDWLAMGREEREARYSQKAVA